MTEPEPKWRYLRYPAHSLQEKVLLQTIDTDGNTHAEVVHFGVSAHQIL